MWRKREAAVIGGVGSACRREDERPLKRRLREDGGGGSVRLCAVQRAGDDALAARIIGASSEAAGAAAAAPLVGPVASFSSPPVRCNRTRPHAPPAFSRRDATVACGAGARPRRRSRGAQRCMGLETAEAAAAAPLAVPPASPGHFWPVRSLTHARTHAFSWRAGGGGVRRFSGP